MKSTNNYMNPEQLNQVIAAIPHLSIRKWDDRDIEYLFRISYHCALRMGEAVKLSTEDFDLEDRYLYLHQTKTRKNDKTVIPKDFVDDLEFYLMDKAGPLFPGLTSKRVLVWINKLGKLLDIPAWTAMQSDTGEKTKCHIFRKSRDKDLVKQGISLPVIMDVYRHDSLNTTSKYLRNTAEGVKEVI